MAYTSIALGLTLTIPTNGTKNWGSTLKSTTWTKISSHDHTGSGNGKQIATAAIEDGAVTSAKLAPNSGSRQYATTLLPSGSTQTIDWTNGGIQKIDLENALSDVTLTLSNPLIGVNYKLFLIQGATPFDIIWPVNVKFPDGQQPLLSIADDAIDIVDLYYDGVNYYAQWDLDYL